MDRIQKINHILDIPELKESVQMIMLATGQIEAGMTEGSHSVDSLIDSFRNMSQNLKDQISNDNESSELLTLKGDIDRSIISFQFYDRLQQRLSHVVAGLAMLAELVSTKEKLEDPAMWDELKTKIRKSYSMESETTLFKMIYDDGLTMEEALVKIKTVSPEPEKVQEIELF